MYPNEKNPNLGIFIKERIKNLSSLCDVKLINPYPWIPRFRLFRKWIIPHIQKQNNIEIYHPKYIPLPGSFFNFIKGIWCFIFIRSEVEKLNKKFNFDIIHAHRIFPEGFASVLLGESCKKPVVVTIHGSDINFLTKNLIIKRMIVFALNRANKIIVVSERLKKRILEMRIPEKKIEVLLNAVDTDKFKLQNKIDARRKLGLPLDKKIILFVGNFVDVKNPLSLIEISHRLRERRKKDFLLIMIGDGYLKNEIKNKINAYSIQELIFLVGPRPHEEIPLWMAAADFLVLPSRNEGMPTVLLEAMACGLPIVATRVGGIPEVINDGENGILIDSNNIRELERSIVSLIDDEKLREKIRTNELSFLKKKNVTWQEQAHIIFDIYKEVLRSRN
jgi:N-acetyl-alpha-D-glucosaminyl L-malate synthase BshA